MKLMEMQAKFRPIIFQQINLIYLKETMKMLIYNNICRMSHKITRLEALYYNNQVMTNKTKSDCKKLLQTKQMYFQNI